MRDKEEVIEDIASKIYTKHCECGDVGYYVVANKYTGEPEQEQCEFCYTGNSYFNLGLIYDLMQEHFNGWIPVSERLPDVGDDVLAILEHWHTKNKKQRVISRVNASDYDWELDGCEISHDWNVSCWQPLPEDK